MTIIKSIEEITIFESPDGGKTVYSRKSGESDRTLIKEDPEAKYRQRWLMWRDILEASRDNKALAEQIEKVEMLWHLIKNP